MTIRQSKAFVATPSPERYIKRLCKHFAHKIPVSFNEQQGRIVFDFGEAHLLATDRGLTLAVETHAAADLEKMQHLIASHFERFAWQQALTLDWR